MISRGRRGDGAQCLEYVHALAQSAPNHEQARTPQYVLYVHVREKLSGLCQGHG